MEQFAQYLKEALESFRKDPAANHYQKGYKAALEEVQKEFTKLVAERPEEKVYISHSRTTRVAKKRKLLAS